MYLVRATETLWITILWGVTKKSLCLLKIIYMCCHLNDVYILSLWDLLLSLFNFSQLANRLMF